MLFGLARGCWGGVEEGSWRGAQIGSGWRELSVRRGMESARARARAMFRIKVDMKDGKMGKMEARMRSR